MAESLPTLRTKALTEKHPAADAGALYEKYGEAVFRRAMRMLRDDAAAKDAVQETFLKAHRYRESYAGGSALSWVFTIADRVCFDVIASKKKHAGVSHDDNSAFEKLVQQSTNEQALGPAPWSLDRLVQDDLVAHLLSHANDDTRAILVHRFFDELPTEQIAERTQASERTIRRRLSDFFSTARVLLATNSPSDDAALSTTPTAPEDDAKENSHATH